MFFLFLIFFVVFCVYYKKYIKILWNIYVKTKDIPSLPGGRPFVGHLKQLMVQGNGVYDLIEEVTYCSLKNDGLCKLWVGPAVLNIMSNPEDCLAVSNVCFDRNYMYNFASSWLGDGLFTSSAKVWKVHRKLLSPAFNQHILDQFLCTFNYESREMGRKIEDVLDKGFIDPWLMLSNYSLQAICQTAFGLPPNHELINIETYGNLVEEMLGLIIERSVVIWQHFQPLYNFSERKKREDKIIAKLRSFSYTVLNFRKTEIEKNKLNNNNIDCKAEKSEAPRYKAFLDLLLEFREGNVLSEKEVIEETDSMIVAGYDTTSSTLLVIFALLGMYTNVQEKMYEEIMSVMGDAERDVEKEDLSKLIYTDAVLKECMRLYPTVPMIIRKVTKDVPVSTGVIAKGTAAFVSIMGMHRNKKYWGNDVEEFDPDRFLDPARMPKHPNALYAFSIGRRFCIGKTYAYMSMKTLIVHTLRKYRIQKEEAELKMGFNVVIKPKVGYYIAFTRR